MIPKGLVHEMMKKNRLTTAVLEVDHLLRTGTTVACWADRIVSLLQNVLTHEKSCESRPFFQGRKSSKIRYQIRWKRMKKNVHQPKQKVLVLSWRISVLVLKFDRHTTHYIAWSLDWLQKILEVLEVVAFLDGAQLRSLNGEAGHMRLWYHLDPLGRVDQIHYYPLVNLQKTMEIHHL